MRSMRMSRCFLFVVLFALLASSIALAGFDPNGTGPKYPRSAVGRDNVKPSLPAYRCANSSVEIDGILDDEGWLHAPAATGFTQYQPDRKAVASEETVFKVLYDDDALYFGVACLRTNGSPIVSCLSRRDNITGSDMIRVYIDPYHDLTTGYHFRITPEGVKEDYYNYGDLYHDISWDAVWEADTTQDENGWYAEIRIPFSSIRYRANESMTWGCNVFQYIHSKGERTAWSNWDRDQTGFMSRSGTITGINDIKPPRQLEITPYVLVGTTDPADPDNSWGSGEDWNDTGNFGADIKYGVTANMTLNATVQPDFGQVEADPSELNLSPYETYYNEKRPFFVEGAQFFYHPNFNVFYSRRIGTGSANSRIRAAAKLTGKTAGNISTGLLIAATDETGNGQTHNFLKSGDQKAIYAIGRFGKQFKNGAHSFNLMQTAVMRDKDSFGYATRNGYVTGADFEMNFKDRTYQMTGSFVGSIVDRLEHPEDSSIDPNATYGTGSRFEVKKRSGKWQWALTTRHQGDELDINDLGYISDANHYAAQAWISREYNADDETSAITFANMHVRLYRNWIYAARNFEDPDASESTLWSYDRGHHLSTMIHSSYDLSLRNRWGAWAGLEYHPDGSTIYETRRTPDGKRGPLMTEPSSYNAWLGVYSDSRKPFRYDLSYSTYKNRVDGYRNRISGSCRWTQSTSINHSLHASYTWQRNDAQWLFNQASDGDGSGIGGVNYVFGTLNQRTWDVTLRTSLLFDKDRSLELYLQPYITVGTHANARELTDADSYDLQPFGGYEAANRDFTYGAVNVNLVYRWEYRPGSTIFLVWTHARDSYDRREFHGAADDPMNNFNSGFSKDPLVDNEAENRFMLKVNYWFSL